MIIARTDTTTFTIAKNVQKTIPILLYFFIRMFYNVDGFFTYYQIYSKGV